MTDQFNTHPQPRTFAPSKEDVLQNLQYFFGAPVSPEKLKDYSEHHAVTHHFPGLQFDTQTIAMYRCARLQCDSPHRPCACADAYVGQNTKIRDTLNNLILKQVFGTQTPKLLVSQALIVPCSHTCSIVRAQLAADVADERRPALLPDPGHGAQNAHKPPTRPYTTPVAHAHAYAPLCAGRRMGRGSLRRASHAARAVRGHVAHADVASQVRCRVTHIHHYDNYTRNPFHVLPSLLTGASAIAWFAAVWR